MKLPKYGWPVAEKPPRPANDCTIPDVCAIVPEPVFINPGQTVRAGIAGRGKQNPATVALEGLQ